VATALAILSGCSSVCGVITFSAPVITVTDASTGQRLCDVTVTAHCAALDAGDAPVSGGPSGCDYGASLESICNVTTVTISMNGYQTATVARVEVRPSTDCGPAPAPQRVNVALKPSAAAAR
jgi:hypothetical protein